MRASRVLLVDDDVDFLEVNRLALEAAGFEVATATGAEEGMQQALAAPIDAAVLDIMMSTPDEGFRLARQLRRDRRTSSVPLLMLSSINAVHQPEGRFTISEGDRDETWLPIERFLDKPIAPDRLIQAVRDLIARR